MAEGRLQDEMSIVVDGETVTARKSLRADGSWDVTDSSGPIGTIARSRAYDPTQRQRLVVRQLGQQSAVVVDGWEAGIRYLAGATDIVE